MVHVQEARDSTKGGETKARGFRIPRSAPASRPANLILNLILNVLNCAVLEGIRFPICTLIFPRKSQLLQWTRKTPEHGVNEMLYLDLNARFS